MVSERIYRTTRNQFSIVKGLRPSETQQMYDEILQKERELGAMLRFQRDIEGRYL